jgi:bacteriocin-like protein
MKPLTEEEMKQIVGGYGSVCICDRGYNCICGPSNCNKTNGGTCLECGSAKPACLGNR